MILENLFLGENEDFTLRLFAALTSLLYPRFGLLAFYAHLFGLCFRIAMVQLILSYQFPGVRFFQIFHELCYPMDRFQFHIM